MQPVSAPVPIPISIFDNDPRIRLRRLAAGDVEAFVALCVRHAAVEQAEIDAGRMRGGIQRLLTSRASPFCWVIDDGRQLIGYMSGSLEFSTWAMEEYLHMDCIFLDEPYRRRGLGSWLMAVLQDYACRLGAPFIEWQTPTFNTGAIAFYDSLGAGGKTKVRYRLRVRAQAEAESSSRMR